MPYQSRSVKRFSIHSLFYPRSFVKRNISSAVLAFSFAALPFAAPAADDHQQMVMQHGLQVMPFDQKQAMHTFLPSANGGVVEIIVHTMDQRQISLVRSHLLQEAAAFARGDFGDPAYIHGNQMPGLAQLEAAPSRLSIRYFETPTGATIALSTSEPALVSAIHEWLAAQQRDHGLEPASKCNMRM